MPPNVDRCRTMHDVLSSRMVETQKVLLLYVASLSTDDETNVKMFNDREVSAALKMNPPDVCFAAQTLIKLGYLQGDHRNFSLTTGHPVVEAFGGRDAISVEAHKEEVARVRSEVERRFELREQDSAQRLEENTNLRQQIADLTKENERLAKRSEVKGGSRAKAELAQELAKVKVDLVEREKAHEADRAKIISLEEEARNGSRRATEAEAKLKRAQAAKKTAEKKLKELQKEFNQ